MGQKIKVTVEIDPRKIDYESINEQIAEKIEAISVDDIMDLFFNENMINTLVEKIVQKSMGRWLIENGYVTDATSVKAVTDYVNRYCKDKVDEICDASFTEDVDNLVKSKIKECLPVILVDCLIQVLTGKIDDYTMRSISHRRTEMVALIQSELSTLM